jgi:hypothetical protein
MFAEKHFPAFGWYSLWEFIERTWHYSMTEPRAVPLLLMLAPLILLVRRPDPAAKRAAWLFAAAYAGWFLLTFRPWRFLLPAFPLAAMTGAYALESLRGDRLVRSALGVVLAVCLAMLALNILMDVEDPERLPPKISFAQHALGQTSREESVSRLGQGCLEPVIWMNENLPAKAKVLYVGEARVYYARHPVLWSTAFDRHPLMEMRAAGTPVELLATMRARGITHVYINFSELERLRSHYHHLLDANWYVFRNFLQQHAREVHHSGRGVVYELAG